MQVLSREIEELLRKGALVTREDLPSEEEVQDSVSFIASYFSVPKKEAGKHRPIANLKPLNKWCVEMKHLTNCKTAIISLTVHNYLPGFDSCHFWGERLNPCCYFNLM